MTVLWIVLAILVILLLLPLGVVAEYREEGFAVWLKVGPVKRKVFPVQPDKAKKKKKPPKEEPVSEAAEPEKKGGKLELVKAALPLVKPALAGVKRRLTIRNLELFVTWAAASPADAAIGYGYANGALGMLWALIDQNFKVKKSRLGCQVDFNVQSPTVYLKAHLTANLWQLLTLALPLLIRFYRNYQVQKAKQAEKMKKEA